MNVDALASFLEGLDAGPELAPLVALASTLAAEIDRQMVAGDGINAALVGRYAYVLGVLAPDDEKDEETIGDLLAEILNPASA